jgi:hypothetical protein
LPSEREALNALVAKLSDLDSDQLRLQWQNHLGGIAPAHLPRWLLMRVLAYRIQAAAFKDLDRATVRRLRERGAASDSEVVRPFAARGPKTREGVGLKSVALLVREWKGRIERVMVLEEGYAWNGGVYSSLSQVAKAITGTNWNGHRFFGLKPLRTCGPSRVKTALQCAGFDFICCPLAAAVVIACANVLVIPGDIIVADDDGVVLVPAGLVSKLVEISGEALSLLASNGSWVLLDGFPKPLTLFNQVRIKG